MKQIITKVKKSVKGKMHRPERGWDLVLSDLRADEVKLQALISIVEQKIQRQEPWPTQSLSQSSEAATQC
jgi:hypothetical protein